MKRRGRFCSTRSTTSTAWSSVYMVLIAGMRDRARPARDPGDLPPPIKQPPRAVQPDAVGVPDDEGAAEQGARVYLFFWLESLPGNGPSSPGRRLGLDASCTSGPAH